jgi:hypothetical protein
MIPFVVDIGYKLSLYPGRDSDAPMLDLSMGSRHPAESARHPLHHLGSDFLASTSIACASWPFL